VDASNHLKPHRRLDDSSLHAEFGRWLGEHAGILHHVAHGFATGADRDDLMQELLLALWRAIPAFKGNAKTSTFVYRVAHNTALTWKRSHRGYLRRLERFEALAPEPVSGEPAEDCDRERLEQVYRSLREFPPLDRSLLLLQLDGLAYAEIAEIHGLTESNVGARLTRLRTKLVQHLKPIVHELR